MILSNVNFVTLQLASKEVTTRSQQSLIDTAATMEHNVKYNKTFAPQNF